MPASPKKGLSGSADNRQDHARCGRGFVLGLTWYCHGAPLMHYTPECNERATKRQEASLETLRAGHCSSFWQWRGFSHEWHWWLHVEGFRRHASPGPVHTGMPQDIGFLMHLGYILPGISIFHRTSPKSPADAKGP